MPKPKKPAKVPVEKGPGRGARVESPKKIQTFKRSGVPTTALVEGVEPSNKAITITSHHSAPIILPPTGPVVEVPPAGLLTSADLDFDPSCHTCGNPVKWDKPCACCGTVAVRVK